MTDSLGVGFRYEEIYEMCQKAINKEQELNRKEATKLEMVGKESGRKRLKNSFKTPHYQGNSRRYRQGQISVRIVGGIPSRLCWLNNCLFKKITATNLYFKGT